jgi:hypothetical protein
MYGSNVSLERYLTTVLILIALAACTSIPPTESDNTYTHFSPCVDPRVKVAFDHPQEWTIRPLRPSGDEYIDIIPDPTLPTMGPGDESGFDEAQVFISLQFVEQENITFDDAINNRLEIYKPGAPEDTLLSESSYTINGFPVRHYVYFSPPNVLHFKDGIREYVFLMVEDHFYEFTLAISEEERDSDFGKGFDHLIDTLEVVEDPDC